VLTNAGLKLTPKSLQLDDSEVVQQVESGNADAALVFVTDVISSGGKVTGVPIPDAQNKVGTYEIAVVTASTHAAAAEAFVTSAVSGDIRAELGTAGFLPPPAA
jgi:molybdate transport system substrate-binding protein